MTARNYIDNLKIQTRTTQTNPTNKTTKPSAKRLNAVKPTREYPIIVPHAERGDSECRGIVMATERGKLADLTCNECGVVVRTVPRVNAKQELLRMAVGLGVCTERCPHCRKVNEFVGFSVMKAYKCVECGEGVVVHRASARLPGRMAEDRPCNLDLLG
jgi:hypothetical protein